MWSSVLLPLIDVVGFVKLDFGEVSLALTFCSSDTVRDGVVVDSGRALVTSWRFCLLAEYHTRKLPRSEFTYCIPALFRRDASICISRISYGNVSVCLAGWVAVCHSRYCIKTTKPILKLFRPSGSPIT